LPNLAVPIVEHGPGAFRTGASRNGSVLQAQEDQRQHIYEKTAKRLIYRCPLLFIQADIAIKLTIKLVRLAYLLILYNLLPAV
jgi:hypothetical protein